MMCGLEIHQRLSGRKLFCACIPREEEGAAESEYFTRRLHTVRSELGEVDAASKAEASRSRTFFYRAPFPSTCLVESDEEPPHQISPGALHGVLTICSLLSSCPVDELHVMRKNVIDGSNTSGFQRTAIAGVGGFIKTPSGKLPIQAVCIEEESAGIVEGKEGQAQYDLSRLGIPLVEIATSPDLHSGKEAQEAALAIGTLLRKTGMVSRGIGTIRQDLNISTPSGARVEIKGVQDLSLVALSVDLEVARQEKLIAVLKEAQSRLGGARSRGRRTCLRSPFQNPPGSSGQKYRPTAGSAASLRTMRAPMACAAWCTPTRAWKNTASRKTKSPSSRWCCLSRKATHSSWWPQMKGKRARRSPRHSPAQ